MKAKKRFYWFGVLMFNNGEPWPSFVDNRHLPDWAISQMQYAYMDRNYYQQQSREWELWG